MIAPRAPRPLAPAAGIDWGAVESIAVLRALQLGDLLCAVPALRALRAAAPRARITLVGLPWAQSFAARFACYIDDFLALPGFPGLPEHAPDLAAIPVFFAAAQERRFDLALQMHGSGGLSNPLAVLLGATRTAGYYRPGEYCPEPATFLPWPEREHEVLRCLRLVEGLGAPACGTRLEFPVAQAERDALRRAAPELPPPGTYACVHPGARLASRRWMPERFAAVADRLAGAGLGIVLTGSAGEAGLTDAVRRAMRHPALDLAGRTGLGELAALLADARLLVCNDTGVSHVAAALGTPSVVVCNGADPERFAPLDSARHRVLHATVDCRPCLHEQCPLEGHPCAAGVDAAQVGAAAAALL
ncbi:MAG: glycosyltransferase family 9 protein [Noviherbaspirillum sp.]